MGVFCRKYMGKRIKHSIPYPYFILISLISFSLIGGIVGKSFGFEQISAGQMPVTIQNGEVSEELLNSAPAESVLLAQSRLIPGGSASKDILVTAYSSSPDETDSTPFITAAGTNVRLGIAAANFLPFGAKFRLPGIFGDQVFTVEDRLDNRFNDRVDIWMDSKADAKEFGQKIGRIELL